MKACAGVIVMKNGNKGSPLAHIPCGFPRHFGLQAAWNMRSADENTSKPG